MYRGKAASDLAAVKAELAKLLQDVGSIDENLLVDDEQIIVFVKNVASLHLARGRRMRDEYERPDQKRIREYIRNVPRVRLGLLLTSH